MTRDPKKQPEDSRISVLGWLVDVSRAVAQKIVTVPTPRRPHTAG